jgi:4-hydroxybenzoate polyprenyltransferase
MFGERAPASESAGRARPGAARLRDYLELVRLPNVFTAMADVATGLLLVRIVAEPLDFALLAVLMASSGLLYAAGVALNDVFDFPDDARRRPDRPLPSGRVSRPAAGLLGWELLLLGAAAGWAAGFLAGKVWPGIAATLLAGGIVLYDAGAKRTPAGPLVMGGCRMLNVLLGMSVAVASWGAGNWMVAGGIGTYVTGLTWFARTEDRRSHPWQLALALAVMVAGMGLLAAFPRFYDDVLPVIRAQPRQWYLLVAVMGTLIAWRFLRALLEPGPGRVQAAVAHGVRSLVVLDAMVCLAVRGVPWAIAVVALLVPTLLAGRWFRST